METNLQTPPSAQPASQIPARSTSPLWLLASVVVGFMLPICGCLVLFGGLAAMGGVLGGGGDVTGLGSLGGGTTTCLTPAVAIVRVEGAITHTDDENFINGAGSGRVIADLEAANQDDNVKAILLRVDSPGGTVTGSAQIYEAILKMDKPVIVSMVGVAASGGYYISAPADYIFARADTITGSIGVIMTVFNAEKLLKDVGVEVTNITSGRNKAIGSPWDDLTQEQQAILDAMIDESYEEFVRVIAEGRNMLPSTVRELADGRIYTGKQALALGLVDELGNFDAALAKAAAMGGISGDPCQLEYKHEPSLEDLLTGFGVSMQQSEADRVMETVDAFLSPALEYRYVGPGSSN